MTTILIKKKDTAGAPASGDLTNAAGGAEIAVNTATKRLYSKDSGGNIIELGTNATAVTVTSLTDSGLTSGRVTYATTAGLLTDSANLTFNGTTLTANTIGAFTLSGTVAGGGNQINNVIIGTSTPLAGAFTTLSATGVATFSAGSAAAPAITTTGDTNTGIFFPAADTIAFTEGGVESVRIDSSGNVGIGTSSPSSFGSPLSVYFATNPTLSIVSGNANAYLRLHSTSDNNMYLTNTGGAMTMNTANTERMRINSSGNVGIGLTSYNLRLSLAADANGQNIQINGRTGDDFGQIFFRNFGGANNLARIASDSSAGLIFGTGSQTAPTVPTERMRIDSSGNVGIGLTPTASVGALQVTGNIFATATQYVGAAGSTAFSGGIQNLSNTSRSISIDADPTNAGANSLMYFNVDGTTRMAIDSTGNVGIGTTSPDIYAQGGKMFTVSNTASNSYAYTTLAGSGTGGGEIDLGNQTIRHASIASLSGSALAFYTNGTNSGAAVSERMRIDSNGYLLVGTTSSLNGNTSYSFQNNSTTLNTMWIQNANTSDGTAKLVITSARAANAAYNFIDCGANFPTSFSRQFAVSGNGVIYAQNTTVQSLSDIRTKENIRNSEDGLDVITALRPVRFDFKEGFGNNRKNQLGFIAQEIEPVFSDAVSEWEQGGEAYKSVGPGALIPVLVKAIQEQQALIQSLTARITALESI